MRQFLVTKVNVLLVSGLLCLNVVIIDDTVLKFFALCLPSLPGSAV